MTRVRAAEADLDLPEVTLQDLQAELAKLETEIHSPAPKRPLLHASVKTVGSILTLAAGESVAIELVKELPNLISVKTNACSKCLIESVSEV